MIRRVILIVAGIVAAFADVVLLVIGARMRRRAPRGAPVAAIR